MPATYDASFAVLDRTAYFSSGSIPMGVLGTYKLHRSSLDKEVVTIAFDFSARHEIVNGDTIASATAHVVLNDSLSTDMTVGSASISVAVVSIPLTDVSSTNGFPYHLVCKATLASGTVLVESIAVLPQQA